MVPIAKVYRQTDLLFQLQVLHFFLICTLHLVHGKIALPKWFADHMVLQTNAEYGARSFLNGVAAPGEIVTVNVNSGGHRYKTTASAKGDWKIQLDPGYAYRSPLSIEVRGDQDNEHSVAAHNVTFGDVFFCSGQSNMVYPLKLSFNASAEAKQLEEFPNFRFFMTARTTSINPQWDLKDGDCDATTKKTCNRWITQQEAMQTGFIMEFSAVCYMTVRDIAQMRQSIGSKRPVGLIQTAWGGTRVEAWMSQEAIQSTPYANVVPSPRGDHNQVSVLYNGMIHPWEYYAVRAVLWYQGEANADQKIDHVDQIKYYATMYQTMIKDWRQKKGMGDFAWGTVQLPPSVKTGTDAAKQSRTGRMEIRIAQQESNPHQNGLTDISAVAVTLDLGGSGKWGIDHPPNKNEIARRLALGVMHAAYATQEPLWTGPILESVSYSNKDQTIALSFSKLSSQGLNLKDVKARNSDGSSNDCQLCCSKAPPFELLTHTTGDYLQGTETKWTPIPRDAITIEDNTIYLGYTSMVDSTGSIRYAWSDYVECVLQNSDGLAASPFVHHFNQSNIGTLGKPATKNRKEDVAAVSALQTPPLGFNSWNFFHCNIDENLVKAIADAMAGVTGLKAAGYRYVNIDDCWQAARYSNGTIQEDPARFPSGMKALADYVHSRGLLLGLYTARGSRTCQDRPASYMYEEIDAQTYCNWGIDYLKVDDCGGSSYPVANTSWVKFRKAFDACEKSTGRPTVLSVEYCSQGDECGEWIADVANLWRTTSDVQATWASVMNNIHAQEPMYDIAQPGHYNDPDMLEIGNVGLTLAEQYSQMALWCVAGAPLLVGTDLIHPNRETLDILTNSEVIAVNQDLGWPNQVQGRIIKKTQGESEVWAKRLADGSWAVVLLNLNDDEATDVAVRWDELGLPQTTAFLVRNLWLKKDLGHHTGVFSAKLDPHANAFVSIHRDGIADSIDLEPKELNQSHDSFGGMLRLSKAN